MNDSSSQEETWDVSPVSSDKTGTFASSNGNSTLKVTPPSRNQVTNKSRPGKKKERKKGTLEESVLRDYCHLRNLIIQRRRLRSANSDRNNGDSPSPEVFHLKFDWNRIRSDPLGRQVILPTDMDIYDAFAQSSSETVPKAINDKDRVSSPTGIMASSVTRQQQKMIFTKLIISHYPRRRLHSLKYLTTTRLTKLCLQHCDAFACLPSAIGSLSVLKILKLYRCNYLSDIPSQVFVGLAGTLKVLEVSACKRFTCLPSSIAQLKNLMKLLIHVCPIESFPEAACRLTKLQELALDCTNVKYFPTQISNLVNLKRFKYDSFCIANHSLISPSILNVFQTTTNLEHLYLGLPGCIFDCRSIPLLPRLKSLDLNVFNVPHYLRRRHDSNDEVDKLHILDSTWRQSGFLEELRITCTSLEVGLRNNLGGSVLEFLPRTLRQLKLKGFKMEQLLAKLSTEGNLPKGLTELSMIRCSRTSYSSSELFDCIETLATRHKCLGNILIREKIGQTQEPYKLIPMRLLFLVRFNKCGRILIEDKKDVTHWEDYATPDGTTLSTPTTENDLPKRVLPVSVWPTIFAKVRPSIMKAGVGTGVTWRNPTKMQTELEASILFRFLQQGALFVGDSQNSSTENHQGAPTVVASCDPHDDKTAIPRKKRKLDDC